LSLPRTAQVLAPVCAMLAEAHQAGLIHRDIKPANIFLHRPHGPAGGELVKVVDFGIAKLLELNDLDALTTIGRVIGTPLYMSAERLLGNACDGRADVFAVAVTCYEALTGRYPFPSQEATVQAAIFASLSAPLSPLSAWRDDVPPAFEAALSRALSREPHLRPTMAALAELFAQALAEPDPPGPQRGADDAAGEESLATMPTMAAWPPEPASDN
jgi:serine/threonine protein kinase